jgi:recombination protein RecT
MGAFELENVKAQLDSLFESSPRKIEGFKTRILKISLSFGLQSCTPESIINAGLQAVTLDLPIEFGQGYVVNYGGQAQFDCGYKGWQVLAKRAGLSVLADVVYECDEFSQSGFGFNKTITFNPNYAERKSSNDEWAKKNLTGVIVSVLEDETGSEAYSFVPADLIHKIVGASPSAGKVSKKIGQKTSPHDKWAEQMFSAKAIKQVVSKMPIDISRSSQLAQAIEMVNQTEMVAQDKAKAEDNAYPQARFDEYFPQWQELVMSGKKPAMSIISQLSNSYKLTAQQLEKLMDLRNAQPIEGEIQNA